MGPPRALDFACLHNPNLLPRLTDAIEIAAFTGHASLREVQRYIETRYRQKGRAPRYGRPEGGRRGQAGSEPATIRLTVESPPTSCTHIVTNGQPSGSNRDAEIVLDMIFNP
jgi:hypothetical protein